MLTRQLPVLCGLLLITSAACSTAPAPQPAPLPAPLVHDVVIRGGTIYDGSGGDPYVGDLAIDGDRISALVAGTAGTAGTAANAVGAPGGLRGARGRLEIDATGRAVSPGFINMLSWADESLLVDGRSLSDIHQGVTLEVFGEGSSMGPLSAPMRERLLAGQTDLRFEVPWTTLGGYLEHLEKKGVSTNVASFVGATTVRVHEVGYDNRAPSPEELDRMRALVDQAMREGALGVGSSLPYTPAVFASTDELVALAEVAAKHGGRYISHVRDEGGRLLESLDEFLDIVRRSGASGEVYHFKASGKANWHKGDLAIAKLEQARAEGLRVTADVYPYPASSTGLTYALPPWVLEGDPEGRYDRLADPAIRARVIPEMDLIPPGDLMLVSFRNPALRRYIGMTLADVAAERGTSPETTVLDLLVEDRSRIGTVRFTMSEENVRKNVALPWVAFCSDGGSIAPEPPFTLSQPHPRTYGAFARVLAKYVREERLLTLAEAVRRLTAFPAENLKLDRRGRLVPGFFADVVVFDPDTIADRATFEAPHQLAVGVEQVFVNGTAVIRDGTHTGAKPGRALRGPGYRGGAR
jgi:N-acyl-D-amino-acid deacylase